MTRYLLYVIIFEVDDVELNYGSNVICDCYKDGRNQNEFIYYMLYPNTGLGEEPIKIEAGYTLDRLPNSHSLTN